MAKKDRASGILLLLMFAAALVQAFSFPKQSAVFPRLISMAGIALCAVLLIRSFRGKDEAEDKGKQLSDGQKRTVIIMTALIILYSIGMAFFGFMVSTLLFIIVSGWLLYPGKISAENKKPAIFIVASAIIITLLIWYVFKNLLYVPLPGGMIFR